MLENPAEEKKLARELSIIVEDAYSKMFIPTVAFNEIKIKRNLRRAKKILNRLVG